MNTSVLRLSNELLGIIIEYMDTKTIRQFSSTCIRLREVAENQLWKSLTIIFQQAPLKRTTRLRVERAKTVEFCRFCRNPINKRLLERVQILRISIPPDVIENETGTRFESDMQWFVNNIETIFPNLDHVEVYCEFGVISTRKIINPVLALPTNKYVDLHLPVNSIMLPPVEKITNCQYFKFGFPNTSANPTDILLPLNLLQQVESLELCCQDYLTRALIDLRFFQFGSTIKKIVLSRIRIQGANLVSWLPESATSLTLDDCSMLVDDMLPKRKFSNVGHLTVLSPYRASITTDELMLFEAIELPNLKKFTTNGNNKRLYPKLSESALNVDFTGSRMNNAIDTITSINQINTFRLFLGRIGEYKFTDINRLAKEIYNKQQSKTMHINKLIITLIPPFNEDPRTNAFVQDIDSGYRTFIAIVRVFLRTCKSSMDLHLCNPEGLEYFGLLEGWLVNSSVSELDIPVSFKVDRDKFEKVHDPELQKPIVKNEPKSSITSAVGSITLSHH